MMVEEVVLKRSDWKIIAGRSLALVLLIGCAAALTGCKGTLYPQDNLTTLPGMNSPRLGVTWLWVVQFLLFAGLLGPVVTVVQLILLRPYIFSPYYKTRADGMNIEVWVSQRKYPIMAFPDILIVPTGPDLKMIFGAAKIARLWGAGKAQTEAEKVAPLQPGDAFVGPGAKYRWHLTGLAVIFDNQKRTNPELMGASLRKAMQIAAEEGAESAMVADMTENLQTQPNWTTEAQQAENARQTARLMIESILACYGTVKTVKIWVFEPANADIYVEELEKLEDEGTVSADTRAPRPTKASQPAQEARH